MGAWQSYRSRIAGGLGAVALAAVAVASLFSSSFNITAVFFGSTALAIPAVIIGTWDLVRADGVYKSWAVIGFFTGLLAILCAIALYPLLIAKHSV